LLLPSRKREAKTESAFEVVLATPHQIVVSNEKIHLGVVSSILATGRGTLPKYGYIFTPDQQFHRIQLKPIYPLVRNAVNAISKWTGKLASEEPDLILNKHCPECPFQMSCRKICIHDDSLSLLRGVTPKKINQYHKKGIFTVTQLSYQFRPRKSRSRLRKTPIYNPELQALAIRTKTTYLIDFEPIKRARTEIFLDFEGIPEMNFYYLAGIVVKTHSDVTAYSFWADTPSDEPKLWKDVLQVINKYQDAAIFHYGHYESKAYKLLSERYGTGDLNTEKRLINVVSLIYGKVYFPVYGNGLKELGLHLGIKWPPKLDSGLQTLVWRQRWEWSHDADIKKQLILYNQQDCNALRIIVDKITEISQLVETDSSVDYADHPKRQATPTGDCMHKDFGNLLLLGHSRYSEKRISFAKKAINISDVEGDSVKTRRRIKPPKARKIIEVAPRRKCPKCKNLNITVRKKIAKATVVDFAFNRSGCRKTITQFIGPIIQCRSCGALSIPLRIQALRRKKYGHQLISYIAYQRMVLRLSLRTIANYLNEIYGLDLHHRTIDQLMSETAVAHISTESKITREVLKSRFIHCDETKVNIEGNNHFVWVLTDGRHVIFKSTPTREADWVKEIFAGYSGILVSDFYAGYDSVDCRQQKCLSHIIRDLNEDLWREPFNTELEIFTDNFKNIIVPIMTTIERKGSKERNLRKHKKEVDAFYRKCVDDVEYSNDTTRKYQKRFERYRESMFTFLTEDGIPWNNNMAERALRHLAIQRKISGSFGKNGIHRYLRLLSVSQTCRFQEKSFLRFLLSGCKDVDTFKG
jgi:predicted RecB family nuclease